MVLTITVETGAQIADANSYVTMAEADAFHAMYGNASWAATTVANEDLKKAALIAGLRAMENLYQPRFIGYKARGNQRLCFPRYAFRDNNAILVASNEVPQSIKDAQCEAALLAFTGVELFPEMDKSGYITSESVTLGGLSESKTYSRPVAQTSFSGWRKVELLLYPVIAKSPFSTSVEFKR